MPRTTTPATAQSPIEVGQRWEHAFSSNVHEIISVSENSPSQREIHYRRVTGINPSPKWLTEGNFRSKFHGPLPSDATETTAAPVPVPDENGDLPDPKLGSITVPDERHDFENMILYPETEAEIVIGLNSILNKDKLEEIWNISKIRPLTGRRILNFYGPPGTGKTMAAMCIAQKLGKPLYQVNYSEVVSKYVNAAGEKVKEMFAECKARGAILFLDEADTLVTKRAGIDAGSNHPVRASHNNMLNCLMQELDKFDGIMVMATNFFRNYDEALLRRISRNVEFRLPDKGMRKQLLQFHLPKMERVTADLHVVSLDPTHDFSGGDILNVCVNSMERASLSSNPDEWIITTDLMLAEAKAISKAKSDHVAGNRSDV